MSIDCFKREFSHKINKNPLKYSVFMIISLVCYIFLIAGMAQSTTISGALEVSDTIENIGDVNTNFITNAIYNQDGLTIWPVNPSASYPYLDSLKFYAKLDKNDNGLSILISCDNKSKSLRGIIPSLYNLQAQNATLSNHSDPTHYCYQYDQSKTLIYSVLKDVFGELKANSGIDSNAILSNSPHYKSSFTDKIYIFGYYITSTEYNNDNFCYHNWPWGTGSDECKYGLGSYICDYSTGTIQVIFNYKLINPKNFYTYGFINNDNSEETKYIYNNNIWLHQIDYGPGSTSGEKFGSIAFPAQIMLYGHKTWSANRLMTWMAIDAESVSASGHITGSGPTAVDRSENPDVLEPIALEEGPIEWTETPASQNDLTGDWSCSLGGDYYIRQIGNTITWYGEAAAISPYYSNIAYGSIDGNVISLIWTDVPKGTNSGTGSLKLEVSSNDELKIIEQTGGWGGNLWKDFRLIRKTYGFQ